MARSRMIPDETRKSAEEAVERFNREHLRDGEVRYVARFKGRYLYLDRDDYGRVGQICRLEFTGKPDAWEFAIYKFSDNCYDPNDCFFPGMQKFDGRVEGAMLAGLDAYEA